MNKNPNWETKKTDTADMRNFDGGTGKLRAAPETKAPRPKTHMHFLTGVGEVMHFAQLAASFYHSSDFEGARSLTKTAIPKIDQWVIVGKRLVKDKPQIVNEVLLMIEWLEATKDLLLKPSCSGAMLRYGVKEDAVRKMFAQGDEHTGRRFALDKDVVKPECQGIE